MSSQQREKGPFFVLELTPRCNNNCIYCYNVWKQDPNYPTNELDTESWKKIIKILREKCPCKVLSLTGGEPLMRDDIVEIIRYAKQIGFIVHLITNGTMLTEKIVKDCVEAGVSLFEIPILSSTAKIHDDLVENKGAWKKVVQGAKNIKKYPGVTMAGVMVVTKKNLHDVKDTLETAVILGFDAFAVNRFNPGGRGIEYMDELLPTVDEFKESLIISQKIKVDYGMPITCNIPMQPCIIDTSEFPDIPIGYCSVGTDYAYYAVDSAGNMRPCNHSPVILGNFLKDSYEDLLNHPYLKEYREAHPPVCKNCPEVKGCQGGCKASAYVCYGSIYQEEPFFKRNMHKNSSLVKIKEEQNKTCRE